MKLGQETDREMLEIRIRAYVYENVLIKDINKASKRARIALSLFEDMIEHNPTNDAGYWANYYYNRFVSDLS